MAISDKIKVVGGIGTMWGTHYHQQNRLYDTKGVSASMNACGANGIYVRKWKRKSKSSGC